jgi:hypothetical protein
MNSFFLTKLLYITITIFAFCLLQLLLYIHHYYIYYITILTPFYCNEIFALRYLHFYLIDLCTIQYFRNLLYSFQQLKGPNEDHG